MDFRAKRCPIRFFFLLGWAVDQLFQAKGSIKQSYKTGISFLLTIYILAILIVMYHRIPVWQNGETLWTDVMKKYPEHYFSYASRAMYRTDQGIQEKALEDLNKALSRNPGFAKGFINRGLIYAQSGDYERAMADYEQAIFLNSTNYLPYLNRGAVLRVMNRPEEALLDLNRAIDLNPSFEMSYHNRGLLFKQKQDFPAAVSDFSTAL